MSEQGLRYGYTRGGDAVGVVGEQGLVPTLSPLEVIGAGIGARLVVGGLKLAQAVASRAAISIAEDGFAAGEAGSFGRLGRWWSQGAENDAAWRALSTKDKFFYELGQKTMADAEFSRVAGLDPVSRGRWLWNEQGFRSIFSNYGNLPRTWATGPTPALRYYGPRLVLGGAVVGGERRLGTISTMIEERAVPVE